MKDLKNQYKEGVEEGINLGQKEIVPYVSFPATPPEQIAQLTGIDVEVVKQWIEKGILQDVLVKHKAEVISMVLTSFNQKAYEEDLKTSIKRALRRV